MKALLVDDDLLVCRGLRQLIPWDDFGFDEPLEAHNGKDAFALAVQHNPDIILSDITMPVMDGLEFCKKISETMADTTVILLSAYENFEYARTAMRYGVTRYLLKPISKAKIEELKTIIQEIIAKKADRAESLGVFGGDIQFKIIKALKEHDPVFIQTFFESKIRHMDLGGSDKKVIYIALINTLYSFFASEGLAKYIQTPQETAQHQLVMMQSTSQMEHYVEGLYLDAIQFVEERLNNKEEAVIGRIKEYVEQNYGNENLSVAFLSEKLFVSVSYLGSIFKAVEQRNLSTYITAVRMEKACELLQKPYIKVAEVAALVGYHDPLYFAKVFKKVKGSTPSDYQRLHF